MSNNINIRSWGDTPMFAFALILLLLVSGEPDILDAIRAWAVSGTVECVETDSWFGAARDCEVMP